MRRVVVAGGEEELAALLELFPAGVEEVDGGFAVYTDAAGDAALRGRFDVAAAEELRDGWEDAWRTFHHGVVVGRFWVGPPWEEPASGADAIVIDPGRAFGTGAHPTTRLTLELMQRRPLGSLVDVGCGSGVLAIAAVRLGFHPVVAVDVDPAAVEVARENAEANGVALEARVADALAAELPACDLAVANVALDVVEALLPRLRSPWAVTSGYLERELPRAAGWRLAGRALADGWAADLLARA